VLGELILKLIKALFLYAQYFSFQGSSLDMFLSGFPRVELMGKLKRKRGKVGSNWKTETEKRTKKTDNTKISE